MKKLIAICAVVVLCGTSYIRAGTWTTLNVPGAENDTHINGIKGNKIFGYYGSSVSPHGFIYDGTTWNTFDLPDTAGTEIRGISNNIIVGVYTDNTTSLEHGFIYDGTTLTTLQYSGKDVTKIYGVEGNIIAGAGGFYDITTSTWTKIDYPEASTTSVYGIDGSNLVGSYYIGNPDTIHHGFIYNMNTQNWTTIDAPGATFTKIYGIDGNNLIGDFSINDNGTSFLYDGANWITDLPGTPSGISGDTIVGTYNTYYENGSTGSFSHGYVYTIPEPATLLIFSLGALAMRRKH
jgi:hypothetical protein